MAQTPNFLITEIAANQNQKEVTANQAFVELEAALSDALTIAMSDADYTLTATEGGEALGNFAFVFTGTITMDRNIIVPTNKKLYAVINDTSSSLGFDLIVKTPSGTGIHVQTGSSYALLYCDGVNVIAVGSSGVSAGTVTNTSGSLQAHQVVLGNGGSDVKTLGAVGTAGQVLTSNGAGVDPSFQNGGGGGGGGAWTASSAKRQSIVNLANMVWVSGLSASATPANETLGTDVKLMGTVFSTWVNPDATHGGAVVISASGANTLGGLRSFSTGTSPCAMGQNLEIFGAMYLSGTLTDVRFWFGLSTVSGSTDGQLGTDEVPSTNSISFLGFRFSTAAGDTNFQCVTSNGSSDTVVDSGIAADTASHRFAVVVNDAVPNAKFYIDGTLVATITTTLPASGTVLGYVAGATFNTSVTARLALGTIITQSDF